MSSSPQPSASLPPSRPSESAQNGTSDGLDRRYLELAELKKKHEREEREQRDAYEKSRTAIEDDFQNQALQYGMLEGAQELHEQLKKMLRENFTTKLRELEDKYEKEKAALKRRYDEAEMRIWGSLLNLDTGVKALNVHEFTVSAPASKSSTPAQRTPLPNGSASKEGPKVPASSGARRVAGSAEPAARVPLPLASRVPSTGPLAYSPEARHGVPLQPAQALPPHHQLNGGRQVSKNTPPPAGYYPHLAAPRPPPLHDFARHRTPPEEAGASFGRKHYPVQHSMTLLSQPLSTTTAGDRDLRIPSSVAWPHPGHYPSARSTHSHPLAAPLPPMMANRTTSQPPLQPQPHPQYAQQLQAQQLHHQQQQQQLQQPHQQQQPPPQQQQQRHPLPGLERRELPPILAAPSGPMAAQLDESAKRKAESLAVSSETAAKRPKQSHNIGSSGSNEQQPARTITFAEVYGDGQAEYQHMIIQFPEGGPFYILKCDEHGVHFGEHPLRGAAKHLASAQHGRMSKEHTKAVETLGHRVVDCTVELMEKNNARVMEAFGNGYKPFNANQLSKTKRALKGFPNLDKPATPGASPSGTPIRQRKPPAPVIWDPTIPGLYVGFCVPDQKHYPVIVLPWNEPTLESAGIGMTMADVGLLSQPEKLPKCYVYSREGDRITGISGWAEGYEDGGPLHKRREFAVIYIDNEELDRWQIGWIQAKNLSAFDLERPQPEDLPFFNEAREYYARSIRNFDSYEALRREMFAHRQTTVLQQTAAVAGVANGTGSAGEGSERPAASTPRRPLPSHAPSYEDSEMMDAGASDVESDRASSPKSSPNSDDDVEMANTDSRRTSVSNRDDIPKETSTTPGPLAQAIAAQALSLQAPARGSGFTAINSRSSASSVEPASRQGSVERRRVEKIYASSRRQTNGALAPSDSTADKAKDDKLSPQAPSPSPAPPPAVVRKPSPASLQHILQESPDDQSPTLASVESEGQSQNTEVPAPASASATPIVSPQPSSTINVATGLGISNAPSVERAESVPAPPNKSSTQEQERSRSLTPASATTPATPALTVNGLSALRSLPTVQPLPSQYPTPLPSATESTQGRTPVATTSFSRPTEITPAASPVGTPTASALSSRATSPAVASFVTAKTEGTPSSGGQTPVGSSEVEVFEIGRLSVGEKEMFNSTLTGGARFQLIDDLKSGVFKAAEGSPEAVASLEIDPKKVKSAVRVPTESGASCLVKVYFNTTSAEEEKQDDEGKRMELVFEAMTNSKRGAVTGKVLAAKFCRRLKALNNNVDCPLAVA